MQWTVRGRHMRPLWRNLIWRQSSLGHHQYRCAWNSTSWARWLQKRVHKSFDISSCCCSSQRIAKQDRTKAIKWLSKAVSVDSSSWMLAWSVLCSEAHIYYVYMVSFALSRYHIWITRGLVLNVICWVSALNEPMRWPPREEDVSLWSVRGLVRAVLG